MSGRLRAVQLLRHVPQGTDVGGDVLALGAVAAGGRRNQFATFVAQGHRQPVDLRLGREIDAIVIRELEETRNAADEVAHVLLGEGVVERQHRHGVPDLLETAGRRCADLLRG
ncbi:hypothetical protein ACVILH_000039 [Bradyrhizobium sp. USDA 4353]